MTLPLESTVCRELYFLNAHVALCVHIVPRHTQGEKNLKL